MKKLANIKLIETACDCPKCVHEAVADSWNNPEAQDLYRRWLTPTPKE